MRGFKKYISLRFKNPDRGDTERMNIVEWEEFSKKNDYFNSSDDFLIEAAIEYYRNCKQTNEEYLFAEKEFEKQCYMVTDLVYLKNSLKTGALLCPIEIMGKNFSVTVKRNEALVSYYPPYIIALDTTYQTRITIDLSLKPRISLNEKNIIVSFEDCDE